MIKQYIFALTVIVTLGIFAYTLNRLIRFFLLTKPAFPVRNIGKRFGVMMNIAFGQTRIMRKPLMGPLHALVFWGFCVILFGFIEMIIDGLFGTDHFLQVLGGFYDVVIASGDIFALIVGLAIIVFLSRRLFMHVRRFEGIEMKAVSHMDAKIALLLILYLMISLQGMNIAYYNIKVINHESLAGVYPVSRFLAGFFPVSSSSAPSFWYEFFWWSHILMIFAFINILPYSKHFHVIMSVPNVFLSRLDPLGKLPNMDQVTREVKLMMNPDTVFAAPAADAPMERFGVKDAEDISWKNYLDSLSCTECGRCTAVCPASLTGKKLSPRKIMMDARARMKEKGPGLVKNGSSWSDDKSLVRDYISEEELWACTTCNACARECPISINHPVLIIDMRRYLVMEEGSAPGLLKATFNNIENNGAPWQYSPEDRLQWAKDLEIRVNLN
ncbi:MAG: 4Fe-4S dicluster domain-containing protein [Bacteroidetes bacterium]|nr:4Fe-4S dicluster domain-containing protein [Bacteroidota bacterium]